MDLREQNRQPLIKESLPPVRTKRIVKTSKKKDARSLGGNREELRQAKFQESAVAVSVPVKVKARRNKKKTAAKAVKLAELKEEPRFVPEVNNFKVRLTRVSSNPEI